MSPLLIAMLGGGGAMFGWGVADFFAKVSIDDVGELRSLAWGHLVGTIILAGLTLGRSLGAHHIHYGHITAGVVLSLIFFGCLQAGVYYLLYIGFGQGQVAVLSPTFASFSGLVALISIAFLGEHASGTKIVALLVIFGGVLLLTTAPTEGQAVRLFGAPGFNPVLAATAMATGWTLGWDHLVNHRDPISFACVMYASMTLALFLVAKQQRVELLELPGRAWLPLAVIGLGEAGAYVALSWGYSRTSLTSVVALLSGAFSLPTIILAGTFLKERLSRMALGGIVAVVGGSAVLAVWG